MFKCFVSTLILAILMVISALVVYESIDNHQVKFIGHACLIPDGGYNFKLCSGFTALVDGHVINVPKGMETDLASIPKFYWSILSPHQSDLIEPSIFHDYLYRCKNPYNRKFADDVFYKAMREKGLSSYNSFKFYYFVRLFGGGSFRKSINCGRHE